MSEYETEELDNIFEIYDFEEELDDSWIKKFEDEDKLYSSFYTEENEIVELIYVYINRNNKIYYVKKANVILDNKKLDKTKLIFLLKKNKIYNSKDHNLISILQYNIDLNPEELTSYLKDDEKYNFLSIKSCLSEMKWDDSIHFFKNLNSLHIIFYEKSKEKKTNTKKIYIKTNSKRKSRKKLT